MSVPNQTPYIIYNANGLTTVFPFEFYVISASDIQVTFDGVEITTGYSVSGVGNVSGGDVVFVTPPAAGTVVMIERVVPTYRLTDYQDNGDLLADTVNKDFDRLLMAIQRSFIHLGLALRRPLLGGPFNAEGYRIENMSNPVDDQDAATKNYVDKVSLVRALRVPESFVSALPSVEQRANKLLAFNAAGNPITVLPQSGSASDVLIELAKPTGANLSGFGSDTVGRALQKTLKYFGAKGDGSANDRAAILIADAYSVANGERIRVSAGTYLAKELSLSGSYIFDEGATIYGVVGAEENVIKPLSGFNAVNPHVIVERTAAPPDGDYGCAIRVGTYRQPADNSALVEGVKIINAKLEAIGSISGAMVEVLGNVEDVEISGAEIYGIDAGIICHWGGDVGSEGHSSNITYSHHPRNIKLSDIKILPDISGTSSANGVIISDCYDVTINNISSSGASTTLWIMPGDVYNQVPVARDAGKVMTGITVDGVLIDNPKPSTEAAIKIQGVPQTIRTAQARLWGRDDASPMSISVKGVNINCDDSKSYTSPLVNITACKNANIEINKTGGHASPTYWAQTDYNQNCDIKLTGSSQVGARVRGNTNCTIELNGINPESGGSANGCLIQSFTTAALTVSSAAVAGATAVNIINSANGTIFNGTVIMVADTPVAVVTTSTLCTAGVAVNIPVHPIKAAISSGATGYGLLGSEGTVFKGMLSGFFYNYSVVNGWGASFNVKCVKALKNGFEFTGTHLRNVDITDSVFVMSGAPTTTGNCYDIHTVGASMIIRGFRITKNSFDKDCENNVVNSRLTVETTNHKGVIIAENDGTVSTGGVSFSIQNSTVTESMNIQQVYGNTIPENHAPIATVTGQYLGTGFVGNNRNTGLPTAGYFTAGAKLFRQNPTAGGPEGWICITTGSPGTWVNFGSVASS
ncbi:TPA: hypothetical protein L3I95_002491 [Enterobacter cloacae]|uniref:phage tail fiber domain-containing protein n=1 Tax=Enterobacter cloacae TaxID=550 RepID=UPI000735BB8A|nr:phage tail fiber protein [Enterobacter cloacae]KTH70915.1 hypothetical protein ASV19_17850 [Enterobacter cloacae subsp. cloacae]HBN6007482.1 hypothetical protein [Enterobacter cloacae]